MTSALAALLNRPKTVLTVMLAMIVAGFMTYISIPKEAQPDIDVPIYFVSVTQAGISPRDSERLLVRPMETKLRGLDGLKELTAVANQSNALIVLEFEIGTDKDKVLADIRDKVDQAKVEFPEDAKEPVIAETNFALQPTLIVTLSGTVPERTLYRFARRLKDELEAIDTVREANLRGNREEFLEVILDLSKLESYNITQGELLNALAQNNQLVAAGFIDNGAGRYNVKVPGLVEDAQDVYSIPIKQNGEAVVTLGDVSKIRRSFKDPSVFTRVNGEPAISLEVVKRIGTNIIENNNAVREAVAHFSEGWPSTVKINFMLDESSFINEVQASLQASIMTAIALVMVVVVASLGLRSGLLVGLSVPVSFTVGFLILGMAGITVNMMVLFGMVLTVGMLVDGAIVVTEYADRKLSEGMEPTQAYTRAAQLMFWPVVSSTATTLAAFLPLLLWPGVSGEFMSYLPTMVIIVLSASLMTALIFLPTAGALTGRLAQWAGRHTVWFTTAFVATALTALAVFLLTQAVVARAIGFGWNDVLGFAAAQSGAVNAALVASVLAAGAALVVAVLLFPVVRRYVAWRATKAQPAQDHVSRMYSSGTKLEIDKVPGAMRRYLQFLHFASGTLLGNVLVIGAIVATAIGVFSLFATHNAGVEFFVDEEPDQAIILVGARGNLSATQIRDVVAQVEGQVMTVQGVDNVVMTATAPGGRGGGGNVLGGVQDKPADVVGELQIELADYCCRRKAVDIFAEIREKTAAFPGITVEIRKVEGGPPTGKDVRLEVKSTNYDEMVATVAKVRAFFDGMDKMQDIEDGRPLPGIEWELEVDRALAGRYDAGIASIGAMVQLVTNGVTIGTYRPDDSEDELDITVRLPKEQRSFDTLDNLRVQTGEGQVPLANFITRKAKPVVGSIKRKDGLYAMEVQANLSDAFKAEGGTIATKVNEVQAWLDRQDWPTAVQFRFRGSDEEQAAAGEFLGKAAAIALFMMFIILVTQFNSFYQTVLTLSTVVLAVLGVLIGLMVTGQKFSIIMTGTGVVALAGIVVNNAIVLIDTFNRLRSEGVDTREAVLKTSAQRLRPIMLTTMTTILGLVPMALQVNMDFFARTIAVGGITSVWWVQLSTAIIAGLAFSTVLTLVFIPSMLALPANILGASTFAKRLVTCKRARKKAATVPASPYLPLGDVNAAVAQAKASPPASALSPARVVDATGPRPLSYSEAAE